MWEELLERVRQLPQFKDFLKPTPFHQIIQAAIRGQVIIINASQYGVDALIFDAADQIDHVPLPDADLVTLSKLVDDMLFSNYITCPTGMFAIYTRRITLIMIYTVSEADNKHSDVHPSRRDFFPNISPFPNDLSVGVYHGSDFPLVFGTVVAFILGTVWLSCKSYCLPNNEI